MQEAKIYDYYAFGYNYYILQSGSVSRVIRGTENSLESLLEDFFNELKDLNLQVTLAAATDLTALHKDIKSEKVGTKVDAKLSEQLRKACKNLEATLDAELQLRTAYIVTPKRFDLEYLLQSPSNLLGAEAKLRLPEIARFDFSSACRAIAFGLATAAAFHLMRCVEAMLREYYFAIVKRGRIKTLLWHPMLQQMRTRKNAPPRTVLDHLDNIRNNFRNPTQHPDARYDLEEAQDLLAVSVDTLNRIARDLAQREAKS